MTTAESEWDAESYGLIAALHDHEDSLCPRCGVPLDEGMDPLADRNNPHRTHQYEAKSTGRCHACRALHEVTDAYGKDDDAHSESLHFAVERIDRPQPQRPRREAP